MQTSHSLPLPRAIIDANAIIRDPERAARLRPSLRRLAFAVTASQRGITVTQRHRPANSSNRR